MFHTCNGSAQDHSGACNDPEHDINDSFLHIDDKLKVQNFQNLQKFQVHPFHFRLKFFSCFFKEKDLILSSNLTPALKTEFLKTFNFS